MTTLRTRAANTLDVLAVVAALVLVAVGVSQLVSGSLGFGALLLFIGLATIWGVGGKLLEAWTGFEPGRHYLLGAFMVFGGLGSLALENAVTAGSPVGAVVNGLAAAVLILLAFLSLYGWFRLRSREDR